MNTTPINTNQKIALPPKRLLLILSFVISSLSQISCSNSAGGVYQSPEIGETLETIQNTNVYSGSNTVLSYDKHSHRMHRFNLTDKTLERSFKLDASITDFKVYQDSTSSYIFVFGNKKIQIYQENGSIINRPLDFAGSPTYIAARPENHLYVITDDIGSIGILQLDENGNVANSFIGGASIENQIVQGGNLVDSNTLLLYDNVGAVVKVDISQTMADKKWSYTRTVFEKGKVNGVFPANANQSIIRIETMEHLVLNNADLSLVEGTTVTSPTCKEYYHQTFFFICTIDNVASVVTLDDNGNLTSKALNYAPSEIISASIAPDKSTITAHVHQVTDGDTSSIVRINLSDSLVQFKLDTTKTAQIGLSNDFMIEILDSPLGYAKVHPYNNSGEFTEIKGFNREFFWRVDGRF